MLNSERSIGKAPRPDTKVLNLVGVASFTVTTRYWASLLIKSRNNIIFEANSSWQWPRLKVQLRTPVHKCQFTCAFQLLSRPLNNAEVSTVAGCPNQKNVATGTEKGDRQIIKDAKSDRISPEIGHALTCSIPSTSENSAIFARQCFTPLISTRFLFPIQTGKHVGQLWTVGRAQICVLTMFFSSTLPPSHWVPLHC